MVLRCYCLLRQITQRNKLPNPCNVVGSQLRVTSTLAARMSALPDHIVLVLDIRTEEKMVWANASGHITLMQNGKALRDRPKVHFPRKPMSVNAATMNTQNTITKTSSASGPKPAGIGLANFVPEASFRAGFMGGLESPIAPLATELTRGLPKGLENVVTLLTNTGKRGRRYGNMGLHLESPFHLPSPGLLAQRWGVSMPILYHVTVGGV